METDPFKKREKHPFFHPYPRLPFDSYESANIVAVGFVYIKGKGTGVHPTKRY